MSCTTILVGKKATNNGSTMISRNDDNGSGSFSVKKYKVVLPEEQPVLYRSVISHLEVALNETPMKYTAMPQADITDKGVWASAGVNDVNVAMTATETITTNERVLCADPLVQYQPAANGQDEIPGGIGEEDIVVLVLPYIHSAREGVERLGKLLEQYGTYENNGVAFSDHDEVWYMETIGGHHWLARRLPDHCYAVLPNEFGADDFDLADAMTDQKNFMCSADLKQFVEDNHLDLSMDGKFNARRAFGSHSDADHVYNTPRFWFGQRFFNPRTISWDGENAQYTPESDDIPWCQIPEYKITVEDVKYVLSSTYQGTPYDLYGKGEKAGKYRPIGINRTNFCSLMEIRNDVPEPIAAVEWIAFASNVYNAFVPLYTNIEKVPAYFGDTPMSATTDSFYWACRLISALADAHHHACEMEIERYQSAVQSQGRQIMKEAEKTFSDQDNPVTFCEAVNEKIAAMVRKETDALLDKVLFIASNRMLNSYSRSDH